MNETDQPSWSEDWAPAEPLLVAHDVVYGLRSSGGDVGQCWLAFHRTYRLLLLETLLTANSAEAIVRRQILDSDLADLGPASELWPQVAGGLQATMTMSYPVIFGDSELNLGTAPRPWEVDGLEGQMAVFLETTPNDDRLTPDPETGFSRMDGGVASLAVGLVLEDRSWLVHSIWTPEQDFFG